MGVMSLWHWMFLIMIVPAFLPLIIRRPAGANRYGPAPRTGLTFTEAVRTCLKSYAQFTGRASRSEYWWFYLACLLAGFFIQLLAFATKLYPLMLLELAMVLPSLSSIVRRLHDNNRSGWWVLLSFSLGVIPLIFMLVQPTQKDGQDAARVFE